MITDAMIDPGFALTSRKEGNRVVLERDGNGTVLKANGRILVLTASEAVECGLAKSVITTSLDVGQMMKLWSQDEK